MSHHHQLQQQRQQKQMYDYNRGGEYSYYEANKSSIGIHRPMQQQMPVVSGSSSNGNAARSNPISIFRNADHGGISSGASTLHIDNVSKSSNHRHHQQHQQQQQNQGHEEHNRHQFYESNNEEKNSKGHLLGNNNGNHLAGRNSAAAVQTLQVALLRAPLLGSVPTNQDYHYLIPPPMALTEAQQEQMKAAAAVAAAAVDASPVRKPSTCNYGSLRESQSGGRFLDGPSSYREASGNIRPLVSSSRYNNTASEMPEPPEMPPPPTASAAAAAKTSTTRQEWSSSSGAALSIQDRIQARQKQQQQQKQQKAREGENGTKNHRQSKMSTTSSLSAMMEASEKLNSNDRFKPKTPTSSKAPFQLPFLIPPAKPVALPNAAAAAPLATAFASASRNRDENDPGESDCSLSSGMLSTSLTGLEILMSSPKGQRIEQQSADSGDPFFPRNGGSTLLGRSNSDPTPHLAPLSNSERRRTKDQVNANPNSSRSAFSSPMQAATSAVSSPLKFTQQYNHHNQNQDQNQQHNALDQSAPGTEANQAATSEQSWAMTYSDGSPVLGTSRMFQPGNGTNSGPITDVSPGTGHSHHIQQQQPQQQPHPQAQEFNIFTNHSNQTVQLGGSTSLPNNSIDPLHRNPDTEEAFHMDLE